jgi:phospholipid/cholesterol/gamma-HCH transport system substrate-binding protein
VEGIALSGNSAALTLVLEKRYGPVYRDGQVQLRAKTLMGEKYVDLDPGDPAGGALPSGGTLPSRAPEAVQLDQILSTLDAPHRRDVQQILDVLGSGLGGRGSELNGLLGAESDLIDNATPVSEVLAADRRQLASLIDDFGTVAASLGQRAADIRRLVTAARSAGEATAARDHDLRATLREAPAFVSQARQTVAHLGSFSVSATPVVGELRRATLALVPAVQRLGPAAAEGTAIVRALGPFATAASDATGALRRVASPAKRLLVPVEAGLRQTDPMLAYLVRYSLDIGSVFQTMRETTEFHDASGGYGRVSAYVSQFFTGASSSEDKLIAELKQAGLLSVAFENKQYNPYPAPHTAGHRVPFTGGYPRIEADPPYRLAR